LLCLALVACADPKPSRVVAIVDAEELVRESTREVVVSVWGGESSPPGEDGVPLEETFVMRRDGSDGGFRWPLRILLRPRDGRDRTYRIRVRAYDSAIGSGARPPESFVAETRAVNRYARGEIRELRMLLIDECIGQMCEENQRCVARGVCEGLVEDPLEPPMDAGVPTDDAAMPECTGNEDCDDENPCTDDSCVDAACVRTNNTATCSDGDGCTSEDTCAEGACVGGADPCAASGLACEEGRCTGCSSTRLCPDTFGEWSPCAFPTECTTTGSQTRSVSSNTCTDGSCIPIGGSEVQMQECRRESTEGRSCGAGPREVPGPCMPTGVGCGTQSGTVEVVLYRFACSTETCVEEATVRTESCVVTVPCSDGGLDAGVDAGNDAGRTDGGLTDAGFCDCTMGTGCVGQPCANGGTCMGAQCAGGEVSCSNGADDDADDLVDCADPDCTCPDAGFEVFDGSVSVCDECGPGCDGQPCTCPGPGRTCRCVGFVCELP
jgi:hypothetical protein